MHCIAEYLVVTKKYMVWHLCVKVATFEQKDEIYGVDYKKILCLFYYYNVDKNISFEDLVKNTSIIQNQKK